MLENDLSRASRRDLPTSRRVRLGIIAVCGIVALFAAACSSPAGSSKGGGQTHQTSTPAASPAAQVAINPANGTTHANPSHGITVTASVGKIIAVSVFTGPNQVAGALSTDGTSWHSTYALLPGARYTVAVTAANKDGKTTSMTSSFRTFT